MRMGLEKKVGRRQFLRAALAAGGASCLPGCATPDGGKEKSEGGGEEEVSPAEDLMREHGVLKRVLLLYRECLRRMGTQEDLPPDAVASGAGIIRRFIEDYHEKLEDFLFPRFRKAGTQVELVVILTQQHQAGRRLTDVTMRLATAQALKDDQQRAQLTQSLERFIRMYEPHEAREDTVLFPALHKIVTPHEYDALGEDFEKKERQLFGEDGFEAMVKRVEGIEKQLGIYDLAQFTPK